MKDRYDVIVVGGGPAGSWTARHAAMRGMSVLVLEKDREIGIPVRCAEGVSEEGLLRVVDTVPERWIAQRISGVQLISPDGTVVQSNVNGLGMTLHRRIFDADLAAMAGEAGADVVTRAYVHGLIMRDGFACGVKVRHMGREYEIRSTLVVGADGVESRVGRWAGLDTVTPLKEMDPCVQMVLANIDIEPDVVRLYFGQDVAPGGYLWVFPKGPRMANVGLGISGTASRKKKAVEYLKAFVSRTFPRHTMLCMVAGGVPTVKTLDRITGNGVMLVGDAAHQANPITGGGILYGMQAGVIAGRVAAEAVRDGDVTEKRLSQYPREWHRGYGRETERAYKIKPVITGFSDNDLNHIAGVLMNVPDNKRTILRIFKAALIHHPKLILEAAKIFNQA